MVVGDFEGKDLSESRSERHRGDCSGVVFRANCILHVYIRSNNKSNNSCKMMVHNLLFLKR